MSKKILISFIFISTCLLSYDAHAVRRLKPPKAKGVQVVKSIWGKSLKTGGSKKRYFPEVASPIVDGDRVFVGTHSGIFYALNLSSGKVLWQFKSNGPIASQPVAFDDSVVFGNNKGTIYALDGAAGGKRWEVFVGGEVLAQPALNNGILYIVTTSREVYALDASTGRERWSTYVKGFEKKNSP